MRPSLALLVGLVTARWSQSLVSGSSHSIIFIFADDLGNNEVGFSNSTRGLLTPNIDRLAAGGVALSNYYVTPLCSPTVSLTPRSCWRSLCSPWPAITHTG